MKLFKSEALSVGLVCMLVPFCAFADDLRRDLSAPQVRPLDRATAELKSPSAPDCRLSPERKPSETTRFRNIAFRDNTVFSDRQILDHLGLKDGKIELSSDDAECIRLAVTRLYVTNGYINSGVVVSGPLIEGDAVVYRVIEGRLTDVVVRGADGTAESLRLVPDYIRSRLIGDPNAPFNRGELEKRFQALLQDPNIDRIQGNVVPGAELGQAVLEVRVSEPARVRASLGANNFDPDSTGRHVGTAEVSFRNITGLGEGVSLEFNGSTGKQLISSDVEIPISAEGLLLTAGVDYGRTRVTETPLNVLDIKGRFVRGSVGLEWTPYNIGTSRLTFGLSLDYQRSRTTLLGEPFSFSSGARNGVSRATVLRVFQEYVTRSEDQALSARSTVSVGVPVGGATRNPNGVPDGRFASWLGEIFYVRRLPFMPLERNFELSVRGVSQVAFAPLLSFEQVALTGADVVRGFAEDAIVEDNLLMADVSLRTNLFASSIPHPLREDEAHQAALFGTVFITAGTAWGHDDFNARKTAVGAGVTFDFNPLPEIALSVGFAAPLVASESIKAVDADEFRFYFSTALKF